jgi:hypothetical protein
MPSWASSARVHGQDGLGEVIGAVLVELDLGVESLFADPDRERARARDGVDDDVASSSSSSSAGTTR